MDTQQKNTIGVSSPCCPTCVNVPWNAAEPKPITIEHKWHSAKRSSIPFFRVIHSPNRPRTIRPTLDTVFHHSATKNDTTKLCSHQSMLEPFSQYPGFELWRKYVAGGSKMRRGPPLWIIVCGDIGGTWLVVLEVYTRHLTCHQCRGAWSLVWSDVFCQVVVILNTKSYILVYSMSVLVWVLGGGVIIAVI